MKNNEWTDIGEKIRDTVQSAIDAQDFSQLNKTINSTINSTISNSYKSLQSVPVLSKRVGYDTSLYARYPAGRVAGPVMASLGFVVMGFFAILAISFGVAGAYLGARSMLGVATVMIMFTLIGLGVGIKGVGLIKRTKRFKHYIQTINGNGFCAITELAAKVRKTTSFVLKDVRIMIQKNMFLEGQVDQEQKNLIVTREYYGYYLEAKAELEQRKVAEAEIAEKVADAQLSEECQKVIDEGNAYIKHIHACNEEIPGAEISEKLSRLEAVMIRIFKRVEDDPTIAPELHKFMNYYLPTTTKLVDAYRDMDSQPIAGANIAVTKREIENTLDTINGAFENLLDRFFQDVAWDISSDISVMRTMLAQEGLTDTDFR